MLVVPWPFPRAPLYWPTMNTVQAIILGIVQGVAEFLPISSSGHLVLGKDLLDLGEVPLLFDISLHLATLLAVLIVFGRRIGAIFGSFFRWCLRKAGAADGENLAFIPPFLAATALTAGVGFLIQRYLPVESVRLVSIELLVSAAILLASALLKEGGRGYRELGLGRGLLVGLAQGLGVFSGISRSGATITVGLAVGLKRELAGEFSFLLAVPAILGAFLLGLKDLAALETSVDWAPLALSFAVAFVTGLLSLSLLLRIIKRGRLAWFAAWLVPVGLLGLFLLPA